MRRLNNALAKHFSIHLILGGVAISITYDRRLFYVEQLVTEKKTLTDKKTDEQRQGMFYVEQLSQPSDKAKRI